MEFTGEVDDGADKLAGLAADGWIGVRQVPLMDQPTATGTEGSGR